MFKLSKISQYLIKKIAITFIIVIFVITFLLILQKSLSFLDWIINKGLNISILLYLVLINIGSIWTEILPFSLLIAIIFTWNTLNNNKELIIIYATGISNFKIASNIIFFGIICSFITLCFVSYIIPKSSIIFQSLRYEIDNSYNIKLIETNKFVDISDNITFYVSEIQGNKFKQVILLQNNHKEDINIYATSANIDLQKGKIVFLLNDVSLQRKVDNNVIFSELSKYIFDFNINKKPKNIDDLKFKSPRSLYLNDLFKPQEAFYLKNINKNSNTYQNEIYLIKKELLNRFTKVFLPIFLSIYVSFFFCLSLFNRNGNLPIVLKSVIFTILTKVFIIICFSINYLIINSLPLILFTLLSSLMINKIIKPPSLKTLANSKFY